MYVSIHGGRVLEGYTGGTQVEATTPVEFLDINPISSWWYFMYIPEHWLLIDGMNKNAY